MPLKVKSSPEGNSLKFFAFPLMAIASLRKVSEVTLPVMLLNSGVN
ncbi:hypothetical protein J5X98_21595 [Leptothermofonsia sichuanensis E412]|nr:hypothetical protein [Leptothermofonsia sichuanensis]QZZ19875.1 hypothetical protein J5X98_21595 [Leptothermofonsia sichuanensis E412]